MTTMYDMATVSDLEGTVEEVYEFGKSRALRMQAEADKKAARERMMQQGIETIRQKFGQKWVDHNKNHRGIVVGMSEGMLGYYWVVCKLNSNNYRVYKHMDENLGSTYYRCWNGVV